MKKKYYLSMLSMYPLLLAFDCIYFSLHRSLPLLLMGSITHLIPFLPLNFLGCYLLYKPIDALFTHSKEATSAKDRIHHLAWYSAVWIFFLGILSVALLFTLVAIFPPDTAERMEIDKVPNIVMISIFPGIIFFQALFPSFITYFLINDFSFTLKEEVFSLFKIMYSVGKKRIGLTLLAVFTFLGFIPSLLILLELVSLSILGDDYAKFTNVNPIETTFVDRFLELGGMIVAIVLITRSFTKPIYSLLKGISKVREGDFSTQAAIITDDEIGILTKEFNEMVKGLRERELIRDTFGKYVTKDVATHILEKKINLEGEVRSCTILVTDIASYTTISEELTPKEIVTMLNEYFTVLVNIIQNHKGVVNKFIGDSIFAMFNVPLDDPDHAVNAIQAALDIEKITSSRKFGKDRLLSTRIGINTGVVVAGNLGSADRMEYTVIGDDVNIAARLEQLNKEHSTNVLLGGNTYELAKEYFNFTQLGDFQLKGKEKSIKVYKVSNLDDIR